MGHQIDKGETGDARALSESQTNDFDIVTEDGQIIRHRLIYVRDQRDNTPLDYRANALREANMAYANSGMRFLKEDEGGPVDPGDAVLEIAEKFYAFLVGRAS